MPPQEGEHPYVIATPLTITLSHINLVAKSGIPSFQGQELAARLEASKIMEMIREKNKSKEINIIVECLVGNVKDTISHMV